MRKSVLVVGACALLGGCALPVPIQVASWAIDALSVITTEKSITDHGISALTNKDCSLFRVVTEDDSVVCRDVDDRKDVMTADAGTASQGVNALAPAAGDVAAPRMDVIETQVAKAAPIATLETAVVDEQPVSVNIDLAAMQPATEEIDRPFVQFTQTATSAQVVRAAPAVVAVPSARVAGVPAQSADAGKPQAGFYYVIGSFRGSERAKRHMRAYSTLVPAVLHGKIGRDGRDVYRVVVGPFNSPERAVAYRRIKRAGIADTWAIRVSPQDWSVAAKVRPTQQADASAGLSARDWPGLVHFIAQR